MLECLWCAVTLNQLSRSKMKVTADLHEIQFWRACYHTIINKCSIFYNILSPHIDLLSNSFFSQFSISNKHAAFTSIRIWKSPKVRLNITFKVTSLEVNLDAILWELRFSELLTIVGSLFTWDCIFITCSFENTVSRLSNLYIS